MSQCQEGVWDWRRAFDQGVAQARERLERLRGFIRNIRVRMEQGLSGVSRSIRIAQEELYDVQREVCWLEQLAEGGEYGEILLQMQQDDARLRDETTSAEERFPRLSRRNVELLNEMSPASTIGESTIREDEEVNQEQSGQQNVPSSASTISEEQESPAVRL